MKNTSNIGLLIHEALKKIYPQINGGYTFRIGEEDFDNALFWENQEYPKPTWEQIQEVLPIVELEYAKTQKHHELIEAYNAAITKPHPIFNAPKLDKLNKPIGFTDAEFLIKDPNILKQETTIVFGGLFLTILKYFELLNPTKHNETLMIALKSAIPIPYLTKNKQGEEVKIALTGAENFHIFKHLFERVQTQSSKLDNLKNEIDKAKTFEDLNKIYINL